MKRFLARLAALALASGVSVAGWAQTTLNVRDADIRAFIADAAKVTGRTFIIDQRVTGKVTVVTDRPLSKSEYFEVFLSTLRANGLVAVPSVNGVLRVQPIDNAASQPTRVGTGGAVGRNSFVTEVVRLHAIDAASAIETVRPLVSQQGSVTANRGGNSLVIVDFADNIRRVREVLARIDTDQASTRVITLKNANAREIATALQALAGGGGSAPAAGGAVGNGPGVSVIAVESSNSVALRGDPQGVARLAAVALDLDQKAKSGTQIKVVFLENADAGQLLPVLQQLVGQAPDAVPQTTLSRSNFGASNSTATGTNTNLVQTQPTPQQSQATTAGGTPATAAITTQGGRTAAVVTRFVGANAIVIAAPADIQRQLSEVIRQLDTRREQVLVEAIVAEVSDATASQIGGQLILGNTKGGAFAASSFTDSAPNILQIAGAIGSTKLNTSTTTTTNTDGSTTSTSNTSDAANTLQQSAISSLLGSNGGLLGGGAQIGSTIFGAIINAVKSDTQSNLLQVPHIVVIDNTESRILVGQEVPITTGEAVSLASANLSNAFRTTQRENVGIQLEVKPQINSSGAIKLFLHQQVSSISGPVSSSNSDLILNKREVETTLTVDDGQIAVIGGLLDDNERRTIEKIPLLGDIPLVGTLFKSKSKQRTKTNLMIFIRPTILRTADDSRRVAEQRYGYLRVQQGLANPNEEPSIDQLIRDYMGAAPPIPSAPIPGSIEDPRVAVPVVKNSVSQVKVKRQ